MLLCEYPELGYVRISPNGKYLVLTHEKPTQGAVLFNLDAGQSVQKNGLYYRPKVFDDGTAELYKSDGYKDYLAERLILK